MLFASDGCTVCHATTRFQHLLCLFVGSGGTAQQPWRAHVAWTRPAALQAHHLSAAAAAADAARSCCPWPWTGQYACSISAPNGRCSGGWKWHCLLHALCVFWLVLQLEICVQLACFRLPQSSHFSSEVVVPASPLHVACLLNF